MPLPIKFNNNVKTKLNDLVLIKKTQNAKKSEKKSNSIIDIIERIRQDVETHLGEYKEHYQCITSIEELERYIDNANEYGYIAIDTETTGLDPIDDDIVGLCLYFPGEKATYVPINHVDYITQERIPNQLTKEEIAPIMKKITAKILMHNAPFDIRVIINAFNVKLSCWWDTQVGGVLLNENEGHRLKELHEKYISHKTEKSFKELFGKIVFSNVPISYAYIYGAHDAIDTFELYEFQHRFLREDSPREDFVNLYKLFRTVEMPMTDVIVELEETGVAVDKEYLNSLHDKYHKMLDDAQKACYDEINKYSKEISEYKEKYPNNKLEDPINIASPDQLQILFYDILGAKPIKGKKSRAVDKDVLKEFAKKYPIAKSINSFRAFSKLTGTYIDNIALIIKKDGRVHTHFNANGAVTGRMSSSDPLNLQNIPSRNEDIRKMFVGQTTYRDVELREDNAYIFGREEEIQLQNGEWVWVENVKVGDVLESGETVKVVKVKEFKVLIGV